MTTFAVIPARGGSNGSAGKSLRQVGDVSLVGRAVEAARAARGIDAVWIMSDSPDILAEANRYGARVVAWSPGAEAGAPLESALLHALEQFERQGCAPDVLVVLQGAAPLMRADDIEGVLAALDAENADSAFSASPHDGGLWGPKSGSAGSLGGEKGPRRRVAEVADNGAILAMRAPGFLEAKRRLFGKIAAFVMPPVLSLDANGKDDLAVAAILAAHAEAGAAISKLPNSVEALVLDFDGAMAEDGIWIADTGMEHVRITRADGLGVMRLRALGLPIAVLSADRNPVVSVRCAKLGLDCMQSVEDKKSALIEWARAKRFALERIVYVGNDIDDLPAFAVVGCAVAPADADPLVRQKAGLVLQTKAGEGALGEICGLIARQIEAAK